jgi:hypothetical protein
MHSDADPNGPQLISLRIALKVDQQLDAKLKEKEPLFDDVEELIHRCAFHCRVGASQTVITDLV